VKLDRLECLQSELKKSDVLARQVQSLRLFYKYNNQWYECGAGVLTDNSLSVSLEKSLIAPKPWRPRSSPVTFFPIAVHSAVLMATFRSMPTEATRHWFAEQIETCVRHASDAYDATHDSLTGLLNGKAFSQRTEFCLASILEDPKTPSVVQGPIVTSHSLSLLAIDIDHFKQVNDTHGHPYGDVAIYTVAKRLEAASKDIARECSDKITTIVARPSGEEFLVMFAGPYSAEEMTAFADRIRAAICSRPLPDETEWSDPQIKQLIAVSQFPGQDARRVSISVGIATTTQSSKKETNHQKLVTTLRENADLALNYAKSSGRNVTRHFQHLLNNCGSIIEHHQETDLVSINLGRNVDVSPGLEFQVFHPDFTGKKDFIFGDGRTKKVLGKYPKYPVGRIVVYEVQPDISFCKVVQRALPAPFKAGSPLEAVPMGSISHLISFGTGAVGGVSFASSAELENHVSKIIQDKESPIAGVFTLPRLQELKDQRGTAFANDVLAKLYQAIRELFPPSFVIGRLEATGFIVAGKALRNQELEGNINKIIAGARQLSGGLASCSVGLFVEEEFSKTSKDGDASVLDPKYALDYARYAAIEAAYSPGTHLYFSPPFLGMIIYHSRKERDHTKAIADYQRLREIGIKNAFVENQMGLTLLEGPQANRDFDAIIGHETLAIELHPKSGIIRANLALATYASGNRRLAYKHFSEAWKAEKGFDLPKQYYSEYALSMHSEYLANPQPSATKSVRGWLEAARIHADSNDKAVVAELDSALASLPAVIP
jgi:diguanylate cyclase (GGDEF)-like protein